MELYQERHPLPSIIEPDSRRFRAPFDMSFPNSSDAMSIPGTYGREHNVPPPLPPPRFALSTDGSYIQEDFPKRERQDHPHGSYASNYGSMDSHADERPAFERRHTAGTSSDRDEGYSSYHSLERPRDHMVNGFGLHHNTFHFKSAAQNHGESLMKKLGPIRTADRSPPQSIVTTSLHDNHPRSTPTETSFRSALSLPIHSRPVLDTPRLTETPLYSAVSAKSFGFSRSPVEQRSPRDTSDVERSPPYRHRSRRQNSDDAASIAGSYDARSVEDMDMDETSFKRLHTEDGYTAAGQKRRAASPPPDDHLVHYHPHVDSSRSRNVVPRGSPTSRLTTIPQGTSVSALSPVSRANSYISTTSIPASSGTTSTSFSRRSPGAFSPGGTSPTSCNSPYATSSSLNTSPRESVASRPTLHTRTLSAASPRKLTEGNKPGPTKVHGFLMCECCPKKPKKFETVEELNAHEAEKQYECSYCGNRFKNKNEAERHQNSLHLRRHSWSCSALTSPGRAFHESTNRPGEADTCGYCGVDFERTKQGPAGREISEQDWQERARHLSEAHKFRECNSSKKFFRADHFRQHLKHSHAGTSGKWTNMLENACMLEEEPPTPR